MSVSASVLITLRLMGFRHAERDEYQGAEK